MTSSVLFQIFFYELLDAALKKAKGGRSGTHSCLGSFNTYVDKKSGVGGQLEVNGGSRDKG